MWKSVVSWVAGIAGSVIAAVLVWHFTKETPHTPPNGPPPATMGELLLHTNLQGNDIANLDNSSITTAGDCSIRCQQTPQCRAMTFVDHPTGGGVCWLKDVAPVATYDAHMTSAIKTTP